MTEPTEPSAPTPGGDDNLTVGGRKRRSLTQNTAIMAAGTATSRALGLVRNAMLVAAIGVNSLAANAYDIANRLPNAMFAIIAAGVLNAALVPQIVKAFHRDDGKRTVDRLLTIGGVLSLAVTAIFTLFAQGFVLLYTHDWAPELVALATAFSFWCIPQLFFYCLYTLLGQVLNAREQFGPFMWAPVVNNVIAIAGLAVYLVMFGGYVAPTGAESLDAVTSAWTPDRIALLAGVATLGIAAQALVLIVPLVRGGYRWKWRWRGPKGELRTVGVVATWALAAVLVEQVGVAAVTRVASAANPDNLDPSIAGNAAYFQALTIYLVPHSLVTISLVTAMYTAMARHVAAHDTAALRADVSRGLRSTGVFTIFATVAMIVLAPYLVRVTLPTASTVEIESVARVMIAMVLGLVPLGATVLFKRLYFVLEDAKSIFYMHIPMAVAWVAVAYGFQWLTDPYWWTVGVGLGLATSNFVGLALRAGGIRRRLGGLDGRRVLSMHARALLAALVAGGLGWLGTQAVSGLEMAPTWAGVFSAVGVVVVLGTVMLVTYGAMLRVLRVEELSLAIAPIMRRLGRR